MRRKLLIGMTLLFALSVNVQATPVVAVDIAPLHSLVSQVMAGVGEPKLLIPAEASPHFYNLRPSEAKALANADVVFWIGEGLTPWLAKAMKNVASAAQKIEVLDIEGTTTYRFREGATFESHDHAEEQSQKEGHKDKHHDDHKDHGHDDHKDHGHDDHKDHEHAHHDHDEKHDDHEKHDAHHHHQGSDPHAWLDPENAKRWLMVIAETLSKQDAQNAATYNRNAAKAIASLDNLIQTTQSKISALGNPKFVVFHDAYQYFERRFGIAAAGSIAFSNAEDPSPARIKDIRDMVKTLGVNCIFTEPQYNPGLVKTVFEGTPISTIGVIDPL
ncbi:MAG: zinc ABC transporter substrate-binding protein, partial [Pseudomonadota bacterium]